MIHEDPLKSAMYVIHGSYIPRDAVSIYSVPDRNIPEVSIELEYLQEEQDTPLVESYNQQKINAMDTLNGIFFKHVKEEYLTSQATMRLLEVLGYQSPL